MNGFPKIFALGTKYILDIFNENVEVTEKIDGSQFAFGKLNGELVIRSKGAILYTENPEKMFQEGIEYVSSISERIPDNMIFYAEYLKKQKHNTLKYDRIPKNHLVLFAAMNSDLSFDSDLQKYSDLFEIEMVPVLFSGKISDIKEVEKLLDQKSILGGADIEGVVVKNYTRPFMLGGVPIPLMSGKYVSEKFKEVHNKNWKENSGKSKIETYFSGFRTEARWEKAIQHLRDAGKLSGEPKDIRILFKEIKNDIESEEKEAVKEFLWNQFKGDLNRTASAGFPEFYKKKLLNNSFE